MRRRNRTPSHKRPDSALIYKILLTNYVIKLNLNVNKDKASIKYTKKYLMLRNLFLYF